MKIDKDMIVKLLASKGQHDQAAEADRDLPGQVDTEADSGLLSRFGLDVSDLTGLLGGGGLGDVGKKLGGFLK
jgi:hypothetical protein